MPLGDTFRFCVYNESGDNLESGDINIEIRFWKFDSDGAMSYSAEFTCDNQSTINDDAYGTVIDQGASETDYDNATNKYLGFHGRWTVACDADGGTGPLTLYLQHSPDAGTDWPDNDGKGIILGVLDTTASATVAGDLTYG